MRNLKHREWKLIRELAAELSLRQADRNAIERVKSYIQTQHPTYDQLMDWLTAFEKDGFLAARSHQTWKHARVAKNVVETLADSATRNPEIIALILGYISRLQLYYEEQRSLARETAPPHPRLSTFSDRDMPPPLPSVVKPERRTRDSIPEPREDVSETANEFMRFLQHRGKKSE